MTFKERDEVDPYFYDPDREVEDKLTQEDRDMASELELAEKDDLIYRLKSEIKGLEVANGNLQDTIVEMQLEQNNSLDSQIRDMIDKSVKTHIDGMALQVTVS